MSRAAAGLAFAVVSAGTAAVAGAAEGGRASRFEAWLGGSLADPALDTPYVTRYSPTFGLGPVDSSAGQSLRVHASTAAGGEVGLGWSPDGRWAFRFSAGRSAGDLAGANTPYSWSVRFVTLPPPDLLPQTVEASQSLEWPDTEGRLRANTFAIAIARGWQGRRMGGGLSGGAALVRASGEVGRLGFTALHLGGHSTFFTQEFEVEAALDPRTVAAFHVGGEVDVALAPSWRLRLGYRYLRGSTTLTPRVTRVVNADEILLDEPLSRIETELALQPLRLDLSSSRLLLSLVFGR